MHNADTQRLLQRRRTGEPSGLPRAHHRRAQPDRHPASNGNAEDARTSAHVDRQAALDPNLNDRLAIGRNASAALLRACHAVISGVPALRRHARDTGAGTRVDTDKTAPLRAETAAHRRRQLRHRHQRLLQVSIVQTQRAAIQPGEIGSFSPGHRAPWCGVRQRLLKPTPVLRRSRAAHQAGQRPVDRPRSPPSSTAR